MYDHVHHVIFAGKVLNVDNSSNRKKIIATEAQVCNIIYTLVTRVLIL